MIALKNTLVQAEGASISTILDQLTTMGFKYPSKRDAQCQTSINEQKDDCDAVDVIKVKPQSEQVKAVSYDKSASGPSVDYWVLTLQVLSTWGSKSQVGLTEVSLCLIEAYRYL